MPWTTPETFTAGQTLTAASMNVLSGNDAYLYAALNVNAMFHLADEKASGVGAQTLSATTWNKRDLQSKVNTITGASVSSSVLTLPAGTYFVVASASAYQTTEHALRLQNTTDAATLVRGSNERSGSTSGTATRSHLFGTFTLTGSKSVELQHFAQASGSGGIFMSQGTECYALCTLWRTA